MFTLTTHLAIQLTFKTRIFSRSRCRKSFSITIVDATNCNSSGQFQSEAAAAAAAMMCVRCCLHKSLKISNFIMNLLGIAMIIYCLWLQKKWDEGVAHLPTVNDLPRPWFIYACLGVGIGICLSTIFGYIVGNSLSSSTLAVYIASVCSLLFLQVAVIVTIFFKFDWSKEIAEYIDERHEEFKIFVIFHLRMCKFIAILVLIPQITVVTLAIIMLTIGSGRMNRIRNLVIPEFTRSFLAGSESGLLDGSEQTCSACESLRSRGSPQGSCLSYIKAVLSMLVQRTPIDH